MIPRHGLPFGTRGIVSAIASPLPAARPSDVEKAYADILGVHAVMLLPSVRVGIYMTIQAMCEPAMTVVGPAYTCHLVHEAMALNGVRTCLIDAAPKAFLMPSGITSAITPATALVLSEIYGIPYDRDILDAVCKQGLRVRILDMAMSIPSPERMQRLQAVDVALFSFGWGKPMYAGWGGIACIEDVELAGKIREVRDRWAVEQSFGASFSQWCLTLLMVTLNQRSVYGLLHERHLYRWYKHMTSSRNEEEHPPTPQDDVSRSAPCLAPDVLSHRWTRPMSHLNRKLAVYNLRNAMQHADLRRRQAEIYARRLVESGIACGAGINALPQSHFPIRVSPAIRDALCDYLRGRGIDTGTLFPFSTRLNRSCYPHASEAGAEVVTLPLGPTITLNEVEMIATYVKSGLRALL
ncbi:DegT/DnrJ/EryC1/StrS family aminotransferase [Candidatus Methylomirabilis sp.]|uniref:DegT/DnrJ/EryC1/StrS family aminotransferase n=1 Tax=Candidatus Methylomirabilis sp. TaxID=2032687 RepID=UPI00307665E8